MAFAQNRARDRLQRVILIADRTRAKGAERVEHLSAAHEDRGRAPPAAAPKRYHNWPRCADAPWLTHTETRFAPASQV